MSVQLQLTSMICRMGLHNCMWSLQMGTVLYFVLCTAQDSTADRRMLQRIVQNDCTSDKSSVLTCRGTMMILVCKQ
jgi:hypothetical protein